MAVAFKAIAMFLVLVITMILFATWFFNSIGMPPEHPFRFLIGVVVGYGAAHAARRYYFANRA